MTKIGEGSQVILVFPVVFVVAFVNMVEQNLAPLLAVPVLVLYFLFGNGGIIGRNFSFEITGQLFDRYLQVGLVVFENNRMIVSFEIESECVCVHQSLSAQTQNFYSFAQELNFYPRHVVLLHFLHFFSYRRG